MVVNNNGMRKIGLIFMGFSVGVFLTIICTPKPEIKIVEVDKEKRVLFEVCSDELTSEAWYLNNAEDFIISKFDDETYYMHMEFDAYFGDVEIKLKGNNIEDLFHNGRLYIANNKELIKTFKKFND